MAIQFRTGQAVEYVHTGDPAAVLPDPTPARWPSPDQDWLPATGQPAEATRVRVRPLTHDELQAAFHGDGFEAACFAGVVAIDGEPPPPLADLAPGWGRAIANLVVAITTLPMTGPALRSKAGASQASTTGG